MHKTISSFFFITLLMLTINGCTQSQNTIKDYAPLPEKEKKVKNNSILNFENNEVNLSTADNLKSLKKSEYMLSYNNRRFFIIIQLTDSLSKQSRDKIKELDIKIISLIKDSSYYASVPESSLLKLETSGLINGWAKIPSWAKTDAEYKNLLSRSPALLTPITVKVNFHEDFPEKYQEDVFLKAGITLSNIKRISSNKFEVIETLNKLNELIKYNSIEHLSANNAPYIST